MRQATIGIFINSGMTILAYVAWQDVLAVTPSCSSTVKTLEYTFYFCAVSIVVTFVGLCLTFLHDRHKSGMIHPQILSLGDLAQMTGATRLISILISRLQRPIVHGAHA